MTQTLNLTPKLGAGARDLRPAAPRRGPPKQVRLLLPVWGAQFIVQFLQVSLPTLLAPGNLPSVAAALPCTFVFLTNSEGVEILRNHPATIYLRSICDVEFDNIDDLITGDNYSTTLTLGYGRAVRATGANMLDTCFFFLISDYVMADGSLSNVLARIQGGASGVLAGNFQVAEEDAKEALFERFDAGEPSMTISARDLMDWAVNYLHPMTLANTVNFPLYFSSHSNRLFWRVDGDTLIGRFYLMHMIAIRPEVKDFHIGSSCDYSFIPEMCPSDNVHVMADSDEYFIVEMQKRAHESRFIKLGVTDRAGLAKSLAAWTTERHRTNVHSVVIYHAKETSLQLAKVIAESREFVEAIEAALPPPQPYRDHPYWTGAIAAHRREVWKRKQEANPLYVPEDLAPTPKKFAYHDFLFRFRDFFFGRPMRVRPWHPRWPDYRSLASLLDRYLSKKPGGRSLILSTTPAIFQDSPRGPTRNLDSIDLHKLLELDGAQYERLIGKYDGCVLVVHESEIPQVRGLLARIGPLLSLGDDIIVFILNGHGLMIGKQFNHVLLREFSQFLDRHLSFEEVQFVSAGSSAWAALRGIRYLFGLMMRNPYYFALLAFPMAVLMMFSVAGNFIGRRVERQLRADELCSSASVVMRVVSPPFAPPERTKSNELEEAGRRFEVSRASPVVSQRIEPM